MLICPMTRTQLIQLLPQDGEVAEIGVANGDFSQDILTAVKPRRLHLIDPWEHHERTDYGDLFNVSDVELDDRFNAVLTRFREQIDSGSVKIYRDYSEDAAVFFGDGQLDWVYIDGLHSVDAAYNDLVTYAPKIRGDGFIIGHDYTNHVQAQQWNFGVVEAVNRFVLEFGYEFVALTIEGFPTFVLTKNKDSAHRLTEALLSTVAYVVEIRDFPQKHEFRHKSFVRPKGRIVYPSF